MDNEDYDIGTLLGGPIIAIQEAQIAAEREFMQFLLDYGMEEASAGPEEPEAPLKLREISFNMTRSVSDPSAPGEVTETQAKVRAPLLSLIQMPAVSIEEAAIELALDIRSESSEEQEESEQSTSSSLAVKRNILPSTRHARPRLKGTVTNTSPTKNFRTHGKLNVKMTLRAAHNDDLHGRLGRLAGEAVSTLVDVPG